MAQLTFDVQNQIITRTDTFEPVAMSQNYLTAGFTFSEDWGSDTRVAIFHSRVGSYEVILDENDECTVPWETLRFAGTIGVSVYSGDLITASVASVKVLQTGYIDGADNSEEVTPSMYTQLLEALDGKISKPETDGTDGQVLKTNASGVTAWVNHAMLSPARTVSRGMFWNTRPHEGTRGFVVVTSDDPEANALAFVNTTALSTSVAVVYSGSAINITASGSSLQITNNSQNYDAYVNSISLTPGVTILS